MLVNTSSIKQCINPDQHPNCHENIKSHICMHSLCKVLQMNAVLLVGEEVVFISIYQHIIPQKILNES
jgi:hypothetical protein